jgi:hypothetical protein
MDTYDETTAMRSCAETMVCQFSSKVRPKAYGTLVLYISSS